MFHRLEIAAALMLTIALGPVHAADKVEIGYVNTFTGPGGVFGKHYKDGFELALDHLGRKMGPLPVGVIYGDDQMKPDVSKSVVERMVERDKIDFLAGFNFSNVLLSAIDTAINAKVIVVGANAGPSELAGSKCSPFFFGAGHQNDGASEAMGRYLKGKKIDNVFLVSPNYQAGRDILNGFKRGYGGKIVSEVYTQITQNDYSAELSQIRAANPSAVFAFMPGGSGINFVKQWSQAGLMGQIPLYSVYTVDGVTVPAIGDAVAGALGANEWAEDFPNAESRKFVTDFEEKYGYAPSIYAAKSYDTAILIASAVKAVNGSIEDRNALIAALRRADFKSVRGNFKFNHNQFVIQDYYLIEAVKRPDGKLGLATREKIVSDYTDPYADQCKMN
jgi:branched-chain amino acid transport system substrate-binding protein